MTQLQLVIIIIIIIIIITEPNGKVTSTPLSACFGSETAERDFDEVGGTAGGRENYIRDFRFSHGRC